MSTRSVIARKTDSGFAGVYHHWDGYPSGLGKTLFDVRKSAFSGDTAAMLKFLIDEHPAGWSTINDANFKVKPGYGSSGPQCFCHGGRSEEGQIITHENASGCGCEWAYVFDGNGKMLVASSYCDPTGKHAGSKMIGAFGCGDPKAVWKIVAEVDLDGQEPDWEKIED